jgi:hypothetical protein
MQAEKIEREKYLQEIIQLLVCKIMQVDISYYNRLQNKIEIKRDREEGCRKLNYKGKKKA